MSDTPAPQTTPIPPGNLSPEEWAEVQAVIRDAVHRVTDITTRALIRTLIQDAAEPSPAAGG